MKTNVHPRAQNTQFLLLLLLLFHYYYIISYNMAMEKLYRLVLCCHRHSGNARCHHKYIFICSARFSVSKKMLCREAIAVKKTSFRFSLVCNETWLTAARADIIIIILLELKLIFMLLFLHTYTYMNI